MAEPPEQRRIFSPTVNLGHLLQIAAILGSAVTAIYEAGSWISNIQAAIRHETEQRTTLITSLTERLNANTLILGNLADRLNRDNDNANNRIFELQMAITRMEQNYNNVQRLEQRYDRAFATYQPQPRRR